MDVWSWRLKLLSGVLVFFFGLTVATYLLGDDYRGPLGVLLRISPFLGGLIGSGFISDSLWNQKKKGM